MNIHDVLTKAKSLIDVPEKWCKVAYHDGPSRCAVGALLTAVGPDSAVPALVALEEALPTTARNVEAYNDLPLTTHADIMALFDRAIERAKASL